MYQNRQSICSSDIEGEAPSSGDTREVMGKARVIDEDEGVDRDGRGAAQAPSGEA